jgi:hypothetical protein
MFEIINSGMNHLGIKLSRKLDSNSMTIALDELVSKSEDIQNGKMLYVISNFQLPTIGAIRIYRQKK